MVASGWLPGGFLAFRILFLLRFQWLLSTLPLKTDTIFALPVTAFVTFAKTDTFFRASSDCFRRFPKKQILSFALSVTAFVTFTKTDTFLCFFSDCSHDFRKNRYFPSLFRWLFLLFPSYTDTFFCFSYDYFRNFLQLQILYLPRTQKGLAPTRFSISWCGHQPRIAFFNFLSATADMTTC